MTWAPRSARSCVAYGPASTRVRSSTVTPESRPSVTRSYLHHHAAALGPHRVGPHTTLRIAEHRLAGACVELPAVPRAGHHRRILIRQELAHARRRDAWSDRAFAQARPLVGTDVSQSEELAVPAHHPDLAPTGADHPYAALRELFNAPELHVGHAAAAPANGRA